MDIDELMKYIDAEDDTKKKPRKKNKKPQQLSKNNKFMENSTSPNKTNINTINTNNNITNNKNNESSIMCIDSNKDNDKILEKEFEEFKYKIKSDSVECGQFSKLKPRLSEDWIKELVLQ